MKEKTQSEKIAAEKQIKLISEALEAAVNANGYWLNATGKKYPRFYPVGVAVNPHNGLMMALHSDKNGSKSNLFTLYNDAKARGASVKEHEKGVPFLFYNWNRYVNRNNPEDKITRSAYKQLPIEEQKNYKGIHNREIRTLFNIDQTLLPYVDKETYARALKTDGNSEERGVSSKDERHLHVVFNDFLAKMKDNLVPVRTDGTGMSHYESTRDVVYVPRQKDFEHYHDFLQETLRQIISATGHQQRLAREGMVMKNGLAPSEDAIKREKLIVELASGVKMLQLGLPARLSKDSLNLVDYWNRELKEDPKLIDILESEINNSLEVIRKAEKGEKIEYATFRNQRETVQMKDTLPKHYFIADELSKQPNKDNKTVVLVIDRKGKQADVVLPAGASLEVNNEVPGMSKVRIEKALEKEGIVKVNFYNPNGALGYRPDDSYFADKDISVARLRNWKLESLSTLDATSAVKMANDIRFEHIQMIQDDKMRWALYLKPEGKDGYSIYPDKADLNHFFTTLKQSMDNLDKVRNELANKYYALAETKPDLKVDLFGSNTDEIDLNKIQRVSVFRTKDGIQCAAVINGEKLQPRSVTPQQWQRMWVSEDKNEYKRHLAATLYADVLKVDVNQDLTTSEKNSREISTEKQPEPEENEERTAGFKFNR